MAARDAKWAFLILPSVIRSIDFLPFVVVTTNPKKLKIGTIHPDHAAL
jgi:hypothetical protein